MVIQFIPIILTGIGIIIGLIYYIMNIQNAIKNRQAQLFMSIYSRFYRPEFWDQYADFVFLSDFDDWTDFWDKYGPENKEAFKKWMSFGTYFWGIAVLVEKNLINIDLVDDLIGDYVIWIWNKYRPLIKELKPNYESSKTFYWAEYLAHRVLENRKQSMNLDDC